MTVGIALRDRLLFAMREAGGAPSSSDLRCNFFVSSTAPLPEPVGLAACGLLRIDPLELRRTCSFSQVVMAIAFAIYAPPFIACSNLVAFQMCFARPFPTS